MAAKKAAAKKAAAFGETKPRVITGLPDLAQPAGDAQAMRGGAPGARSRRTQNNTPSSSVPSAAKSVNSPSLPSSSAGAAGALFGDGGPMYGSTAPAITPAAQPTYNAPTSMSSAPSFAGTATEALAPLPARVDNPAPGLMTTLPGSSSGPLSLALPAASPSAPTVPFPGESTYVPPTQKLNDGTGSVTLAGVISTLQYNMAGQTLPDPSTNEFRTLAARYGYTSWV